MKKNTEFLELLSVSDDPTDLYKIDSLNALDYFIPDIERVIRSSREYRGFVYWMRSKHKQSKDIATGHDSFDVDFTIEMHHVIYLYDIVYVTGAYMLDNLDDGEFLMTYDIASQVMKDHFQNIIAIAPLSKTYHQLLHSGEYDITNGAIHGNYKEWLEKYKDHISDFQMEKFKQNLHIA